MPRPLVVALVVVGFGLVYGALLLGVVVVIRGRRRRRLRARSRLECGLRLLEGELAGVSRRWKHGEAEVAGGVLVWHQGLLGGQLRGRARGTPDVRIRGPLSNVRKVTPREYLLCAPHAFVYRSDQGTAVVEVAMLAPTAAWVLDVLNLASQTR